MKLILSPDHSPEENLALDEYCLSKAGSGEMGESVRFWESPEYFVVLGRSCGLKEDCCEESLRRDQVKILRRISGGGTVLQGPGCLNFSLVLSYDRARDLREIRSSYSFILEAIAKGLRKKGIEAGVLPLADIAVGDKKFSGNAQARKKKYFLHHGTLLFDMDLDKVSRYLTHPPKEPEYRRGRAHGEFITNIGFSRDELVRAILDVFPSDEGEYSLNMEDKAELKKLTRERYLTEEWNLQF